MNSNSESSDDEKPKKKKIKSKKSKKSTSKSKSKSKSKTKKTPSKSSKSPSKKKEEKIPLSYINFKNNNKISRDDLKNGHRIFNNKTELKKYDENDPEFNKNFIEFRQLFFENLLLTEELKDDSKIENIKNKIRASSALFSTFIYDGEFIEPFINKFKLPSIIIRHEEGHKYNSMDEYGNYIKFIFPKISNVLSWGKFHSKLILLKFPNFLRIIVPSANLTECDWYYWGQIIWFQDFPLINNEELNEEKSEDFRKYLKNFMNTFMPHNYEDKRFWTDLEINFDNYDFSKASVDLIASANGRFVGEENKELFGVGRLNALMCNKYFDLDKNNNLLVQCSSFGVPKQKKFFENLYNGFNLDINNVNVDIYYPTQEYIETCDKGEELSSCLFFNEAAYKLHEKNLHNIVLKEKFKDRKTVFHSKIFITGNKNKNGKFILNDNSIIYIGSHNLSVSAWGNYEKNDTQVSCANYELGIIFDSNLLKFDEKLDIYNNFLFNFDAPKYSTDEEPFISSFE